MKCSHCPRNLEYDWLFCPQCGSKIKSVPEAGAGKNLGRSVPNEERDHLAQYGSALRDQVFEVVVRHALAGAPWKEICAGPMLVNDIDPLEVEAEVLRRNGISSGSPLPAKSEIASKKPGRLLKFPRPVPVKEKSNDGQPETGDATPPENQ